MASKMALPIEKIDPISLTAMSDAEIVDEIAIILRRVVPHELPTVTLESSLVDDIGIDSLGTYELIMDAEDRFGIEIGDDQLVKIKSIRDIVGFVRTCVE